MRKGSRSTPTFQSGHLTAPHGLPMDRSPSLPALLAAHPRRQEEGKEGAGKGQVKEAGSKFPELSSGHTFAQAVSSLRSPSHRCQLRSPQHFKVSSSLRHHPAQLGPSLLPAPLHLHRAPPPRAQGHAYLPAAQLCHYYLCDLEKVISPLWASVSSSVKWSQ